MGKKVLIPCEFSAINRDEFRRRGHDAWSNDLLPTEGDPRWHIQGDCRDAISSQHWDLIIMHIPCTAMGVCGNRTYGIGKPRHSERISALKWSIETWGLACAHADRVALENPASTIFPLLRERGADVQYIQPWQHGHMEQKKTGLALVNLPRLTPTNDVYDEMMKLPRKDRERVFFMSPSSTRAHERSRFYTGIAKAMDEQWG
jgi:hypothetical protein